MSVSEGKRERLSQLMCILHGGWRLLQFNQYQSQFDISTRDLALTLDSVSFQMMMAALSQKTLSLLVRSPAVSSGILMMTSQPFRN